MNPQDHKPAPFLVRDPHPTTDDGEFVECLTGQATMTLAHELSAKHPGEFIDIYQLATCVRHPGEDHADG
jgi:hypothetical protein